MDETRGMALNTYLARSGVCSRRAAVEKIKRGVISVNGEVILQPYYRVVSSDSVLCEGKTITEEKAVFLLLNKPAGYITTVSDPQGRPTVLDLISEATDKRIYPVGRLDQETTGLLLCTNDGELAFKLAHPSYQVSKLYHVTLAYPLVPYQYQYLKEGVKLADGFIKPDHISSIQDDYARIAIRLHSGANRIIRRMFNHIGSTVTGLDRKEYACLTQNGLAQGKSRLLHEHEVNSLRQSVELKP